MRFSFTLFKNLILVIQTGVKVLSVFKIEIGLMIEKTDIHEKGSMERVL